MTTNSSPFQTVVGIAIPVAACHPQPARSQIGTCFRHGSVLVDLSPEPCRKICHWVNRRSGFRIPISARGVAPLFF